MFYINPSYNPFETTDASRPLTFPGTTYTFPSHDAEKELLRQLVEAHKQNAELWKQLAEERGKK